jgi:uncharacterized protein
MEDRLTPERLAKYFALTTEALAAVRKAAKDKARLAEADDFLDMATRYFEDAKHFEAQGDLVTAFAAVTYAHAWLDAGARIGLFKVTDSRLFVVDGKPSRPGTRAEGETKEAQSSARRAPSGRASPRRR